MLNGVVCCRAVFTFDFASGPKRYILIQFLFEQSYRSKQFFVFFSISFQISSTTNLHRPCLISSLIQHLAEQSATFPPAVATKHPPPSAACCITHTHCTYWLMPTTVAPCPAFPARLLLPFLLLSSQPLSAEKSFASCFISHHQHRSFWSFYYSLMF